MLPVVKLKGDGYEYNVITSPSICLLRLQDRTETLHSLKDYEDYEIKKKLVNIFSKFMVIGNSKILKFFAFIILMLCSGFMSYAQPLIAMTVTDENMTELADATMAKLSEKNVSFVERIKIDRVIKEQRLSTSGLVNASYLIRTGAILRADIIIVLTHTFDKTRFVAFDVKTGIRLHDYLFNSVEFETKLELTASAIFKSIEKYQSIKTKNVTLFSFLPINLISLQQNGITSAEMTELFLKQELLKNENYLVLERDQIDTLVNEKIISQSALNDLLPGSYIVELEVQAEDASGDILAANLVLKKHGFEKIAPIKVVYQIGSEKEISLKIVKKLDQLLKTKKTDFSSNRKAEALAYLKDSETALKSFDPGKSILSAKNAYLLDSTLKKQVNELLEGNYSYLANQLKNCKYSLKKESDEYNKFLSLSNLAFDLMAFYKTINGQPITPWILDTEHLSVLPLELQKKITQGYNEYFLDRLAIIKQKYDYKKKTPESFEYLLTYKDYLEGLNELTQVQWTCAYWTEYMAPELLNYLNNVEIFYKKDPRTEILSALVMPCRVYIRVGNFYLKDNEFNTTAFEKACQILQRMLDCSIISWKVIALIDLNSMTYYYDCYMRFSVNFDPYPNYGVNFVRAIYNSSLIKRMNSPEKKYEFLSSFLNEAAVAPLYIKDSIADYLAQVHGSLIKNEKIDTMYIKAVRAGLPMTRFMSDFSLEQLIQLKEATKNIDNPDFKKLLDSYIGYKTKKSNQDKTEFKTEEYLSLRQKKITMKEILYKSSYGSTCHSFFYPSKAFFEKNTIYIPLYDNGFIYFALVKINIEKDGEATVSKIKESTIDLPGNSDVHITCMGPRDLFLISSYGAIVIYPKDGTIPQIATVQAIANANILSACYLNEKVYIGIGKADGKKLPTEIIEFDPSSKTARVVFSEKQTVNNPFKSLPSNMEIHGKILADTKGNCLTMAVKNNLWNFYPNTGEWKNTGEIKRYAGTPSVEFEYVNDTFLVSFGDDNMLKLIDVGKEQCYINKFAQAIGVKPEQYEEYSSLQFKLMQGNKSLYIKSTIPCWAYTVPCGANLYMLDAIIFLKQKKIVRLRERILLPFIVNERQYYVSYKYFSDTKADLELWLNSVNQNVADANDFDKIVVHVSPKSSFVSPSANSAKTEK